MSGKKQWNSHRTQTGPPSDPLEVPNPITPDFIPKLQEYFRSENLLTIQQTNSILAQARKTLEVLPNIVELTIHDPDHITLLGDTHGQYYDVLNVFSLNGTPSPDNPYLFNGDFVDRGSFGCEIALLLLSLKIAYPKAIHLLRGNHEASLCTQEYGFKNEVNDKYNETVYQNFLYVFNALPLCAVINKKIFVVHGGLWTRKGVHLDEIKKVNRFLEPGEEGGELLMAQMLWSDPMDYPGQQSSLRPFGCSFGPDYTEAFLEANDLECVVRSHEVRDEGFSIEHGGKLITLFSAPGYCGDTNKGAYLILKGDQCEKEFHKFAASPHPNAPTYFQVQTCSVM
ncbi:putative Serine/threonine-protein phosphatase [Blattamonas nauphoetae]|uniref:Serine/threonine-protein phosphatase n=1 Tax=Blattamonas nauphoetae TaxID=2049346 RepID=A0ABQ9YKD3_9EUKA|nr:putative Serine/threonine-protein phosphatase [Blattamonas nauphoetae]